MKPILRTMSGLVETGLRLLFRANKRVREPPALPTFHSGGHLVDIDNRDALYNAMHRTNGSPNHH